MTFDNWLSLQRRRDDPVGDFARDAAGDTLFPKSSDRSVYAEAYASWFHPVDDEIRLMFDHIWGEYEADKEWERARLRRRQRRGEDTGQ